MDAKPSQLCLWDERCDVGRWLAEGERLSERYGARVSAAVVAAKTAFFSEQASVSLFLAELCETGDAAAAIADKSRFYEFSSYLFARYTEWCRSANEPAASITRFGLCLSGLGFPAARRGHGRRKARIGIKLKAQSPAPSESV